MRIFLIKFIFFYFSCLTCWWLQSHLGYSAALAAALIGFVGSFINHNGIQSIIYTGAFAGMCATEKLSAPYSVLLISFFGCAIYFISRPHLNGLGGKLGTVAFIASLATFFARSLW